MSLLTSIQNIISPIVSKGIDISKKMIMSNPLANPMGVLGASNSLKKKKTGAESMTFPIETQSAKMVAMGINDENKKGLLEDIKKDDKSKELLRTSTKKYIKDLVASGVKDKGEIRSAVKSHIETEINNQLISKKIGRDADIWTGQKVLKQPLNYAKEVFDKDWKEGLDVRIKGIGSILGFMAKAGYNKFRHPIESTKKEYELVKSLYTQEGKDKVWNEFIVPGAEGVAEYFKGYKHPFQKLADDPLDVAEDVSTILSLGSSALAKASSVSAKVAGSTSKTTNILSKTSKILNDIATPITLDKISNGTKSVIKVLPGGSDIVRDIELKSATRKFLDKEQSRFLNMRNRTINEIDNTVNLLTEDEIKLLPQVAEGFIPMPKDSSENFNKALGLMDDLAKSQAEFGLQIGKLTEEQIEKRRFQPLAKWLAKEDNLPTLGKSDDVADTLFKEPLMQESNKTDSLLKESIDNFDNLSGDELRNTISAIKNYFPDADPIYMRHFFTDTPKSFTDFFLNVPVKTYKPGFLKKSYGVEGYMGELGNITKQQLKDNLARQATENLKWQRNMQLVENLKKDPNVLPLKKYKDIKPGYKIFAPDGYLRFYKKAINLQEELKKVIDGADNSVEAFQNAIKNVFPSDLEKTYIGASKAKIYQIPDAMASEINKMTAATPAWLKILYDKPLDFFRQVSLGLMPRWQVNNVIGNQIFATVNGDIFNPSAYINAIKARRQGKLPDFLLGGIHRTEASTSGKLGAAANSSLVKSTILLRDKMMNTKVIGPMLKNIEKATDSFVYKPFTKVVEKSFDVGKYVDDIFKGAAYINTALKEERKGFLSRMITSYKDAEKALDNLSANPKLMEDVIDNVHKWYYHSNNLTNMERRVVRRAIPFYSWMRWITEYSYRVATEAPVRAKIISSFAQNYYDMTGSQDLPEYLKGSVPIGTDEDGSVYYLKTSAMNPFSTINDLMSGGPFEAALEGASPLLKTMFERGTGEDLFTGKKFTREGLEEAMNGKISKFDPELGKEVWVEGKEKPNLMEHLLRNYIPQYLMMETALTGGRERYTAEGLDTILKDLFKDEKERKSIVKDVITHQGIEKKKFWLEIGKTLGINIQERTSAQRAAEIKALDDATKKRLYSELPIMNPSFKAMIKERLTQEIMSGTPKEEVSEKLKEWILINAEELKKLK